MSAHGCDRSAAVRVCHGALEDGCGALDAVEEEPVAGVSSSSAERVSISAWPAEIGCDSRLDGATYGPMLLLDELGDLCRLSAVVDIRLPQLY